MDTFPTMADQLLATWPGLVSAVVAVYLWRVVCRLICRTGDVEFVLDLARLDAGEEAIRARRMAGRGRPSDQLFLKGLICVGSVSFGVIPVMLMRAY